MSTSFPKLRVESADGIGRVEPESQTADIYRSFFENAVDGMFRTTSEGRIILANRACARVYGFETVDDFLAGHEDCGRYLFASPADHDTAIRALRQEGELRAFEYRADRPDGRVIWVAIGARAVTDAQGEIAGYEGFVTDVTQRRLAEQAQQAAQTRLQEAIDAMSEGFLFFDADERLVLVNKTFREYYRPIAHELVPGMRFEAWARVVAESGLVPSAVGQEDAWVAQRVQDFRNPRQDREMMVGDRWIHIREYKTETGGTAGLSFDVSERRRAEQALRVSETRSRDFAESTSDWFWEVDENLRYTYVSDSFHEKTGLSGRALIGLDLGEVAKGRYPDGELEPLITAALNRQPCRGIVARRVEAGQPDRWFSISGVPVFDDAGAFSGYRGGTSEITERKRAGDALRASEERFRSLADASPDGIFETDADGKRVYVNDRWCEMAGIDLDQARGDGWSHAVHPDDRERIAAAWDAAAAAGRPFRQEYRFQRSDGTITWVLGQAVALKGANGRPRGYVGTTTEITERVEAQQALADRERRLRRITDALPAVITYVDSAHDYRFVNKVAEAWYGRSAGQIVGKHLREVLGDETYGKFLPHCQAALSGLLREFEETVTYPDGRTRQVEITFVPHAGADGSIEGFFGLVIDATERHALEDRLRQSQKMEAVGQLTGGIAHEFNNLLQVVTGNLELLDEKIAHGGKERRWLTAARRGAERGAELTDRLLSFSRKQALAPRTVDLRRALAELEAIVCRTLGETIAIRTAMAGDLRPAEVDPGQLQNALLNLFLNARDAMPKGGTISVSASNITVDATKADSFENVTPGDFVTLQVADAGHGMTEETLQHVFEPFFTTKEVGQGTGLGLSMVYGFAQQSGGFVEIESAVGRGTTVRLCLPSAAAQVASIGQNEADRSPAGRTVLLVEDDHDVRELLAELLISLGYGVVQADDGVAALTALDGGRPIDLLFTDVVMPGGLSGYELARECRRRRPNLKVIYTTGYSDEVAAEASGPGNGSILLRKPTSRDDLADAIAEVLGDQRAVRSA